MCIKQAMKTFNCLSSRWHNIEAETNENMKKEGFVVITRPATRSGLKKGGGQMITGESVKPEALSGNARVIAENIIKTYE